MLYWIIIAALVFLAVFFLILRRFKHKFFIIAVILLLLFFYVTGNQVIDQHNLDLGSAEGIFNLIGVYFSWMGNVIGNVVSLTGEVVQMDWMGNLTKSS